MDWLSDEIGRAASDGSRLNGGFSPQRSRHEAGGPALAAGVPKCLDPAQKRADVVPTGAGLVHFLLYAEIRELVSWRLPHVAIPLDVVRQPCPTSTVVKTRPPLVEMGSRSLAEEDAL